MFFFWLGDWVKRLESDTNNKICLYFENFISFMCCGGVKKAENLTK